MNCLRIIVALLAAVLCSQAWAERRIALVIGNSAYQRVAPLANPGNDAADMAAKLQDLGFEVLRGEDLDLAGMRRTVRDFVDRLDGADMALFYYSGHGLQVDGNNYIAPVDARLSAYNDIDFETLPVDLVLSAMERSAKVNLVFLDACRDNPLAANLARSMGTRSGSVGQGLAKLGSGVGTLIAFATQPGNVAFDGAGRNSPFTAALLRHLGTPGQDITRDLVYVRRDVLEATGGKQVPWENSSLTGEVVLVPMAQPKAAPAPQSDTPDNAVELAYWQTIRDASERSYFEAYLQQYPEGSFVALARLKIDAIDKRFDAERQASDKPAARTEDSGEAVDVASLEPPGQGKPDQSSAISLLASATQSELLRLGCLAGEVDGKWGTGSQKALKDYALRKGVPLASLQPTRGLLEGLKAVEGRVCPLACGEGTELRDGRCEIAALPPLSGFDGLWKVTRRATNSACGWREISTNLPVENGNISTDQWAGKISGDGSVKLVHKFVHEGKKEQNIVKGRITGDQGTGKFYHVGGMCAGTIQIERL